MLWQATGYLRTICQRHIVGFVRRSPGSQQGDSSWRYPAFTINPDWTAFSVSKIPSITFFLPTRGVREASVLALTRCAADASAIPACQDRHGRWYGHREPPRILASRCTAGCAGASPGRGRAWQSLAGRTWARREGRRSTSAPRPPCSGTRGLVSSLARPPHDQPCSGPPLPGPGCLSRMARVDTRAPINRAPVAR